MGFSCEIIFPYNRAELFYCGERLHLSVELSCHKAMWIKELALGVSCENQQNTETSMFGHYIDDPDNDSVRNQTRNNTNKSETTIGLLGENETAIKLTRGTYIFNMECHLPESIAEDISDENHQLDYIFTVKVRKVLKKNLKQHKSISVHHLLLRYHHRKVPFVWPGQYCYISNFSFCSATISCDYVANIDRSNNRLQSSDDADDSLENWLDSVLEKPKPPDDEE
ncbi:uncharacterized protein LOC131430440 [Malaya genurostris]|uniref:uncharacterized protein LOC131430440 n=1 Tax=Malaya genurostris TaxID=325434 RepID=UPI0026F409C1|nr:uncharacterized protein LOC131430440 [Malaya genurostris]